MQQILAECWLAKKKFMRYLLFAENIYMGNIVSERLFWSKEFNKIIIKSNLIPVKCQLKVQINNIRVYNKISIYKLYNSIINNSILSEQIPNWPGIIQCLAVSAEHLQPKNF